LRWLTFPLFDRVSQKEGDHAASGGTGFDSWHSSADDAHARYNAPHLIVTASTKPTSVRLILQRNLHIR
jgi:hypothetical protein